MLQLSNIPTMFVTFEVSKPLTSRLVSLLQLSNIRPMSVTFEVSSSESSALVRLLQLQNHAAVLTGRMVCSTRTFLIEDRESYQGA